MGFFIISLCSWVNTLGMCWFIFSMCCFLSAWSLVMTFVNCWTKFSSISPLVYVCPPRFFLNLWIFDLCLFWITVLWKYLVFRSPSCSPWFLDLCFQYIYSSHSLVPNWVIISFSFFLRSSSYPSSIPFLWIYFSLSVRLFLSWKMFPKYSFSTCVSSL